MQWSAPAANASMLSCGRPGFTIAMIGSRGPRCWRAVANLLHRHASVRPSDDEHIVPTVSQLRFDRHRLDKHVALVARCFEVSWHRSSGSLVGIDVRDLHIMVSARPKKIPPHDIEWTIIFQLRIG